MDLIDADLLPPDVRPSEPVPVPELGGGVLVQALDLVERLSVERLLSDLKSSDAEEDEVTAQLVPRMLELCVRDGKGRPVKSADGWVAWASSRKRNAVCVELFNVAWRISGMSLEDAEKNSEASPP